MSEGSPSAPVESARPVLELRGLDKTYMAGQPGEVRVLAGAALRLAPGEVAALVAPSGAGKSTLLHIAGLLDTADAGEVWLSGREMSHLPDSARTAARRDLVGFVYQFHHLLPEFSASENVVLPQLAAGVGRAEARARAEELLAAVGLSGRAGHRPAELSGGEQQRVAFCRALANRPRLLLADEPTGNLDPATSDAVFDVLMGLVRETGLAALVATHNPGLAARMDRVLRLDEGRLVEARASQPTGESL
ncbi:ABC transporter ATP-binding protein [Rhodovulum sp. 12E13]|uniref:ABC transporter ATP-binding protein n=1 Tax=Rhodovulum sp. 12E13 TaxID=2203891 RepID=UPI000E129470|nr:ABC transporter ATP-binding protein [Rhodovulum sp. 12E13]RDC73146.1 ABC transporter ATP-binding protein [Rhodovulum sp. 12E13]